MRTLYQLDTTTMLPIMLFEILAHESSMPFFCVEAQPPATESGKVLWWETELDSVADHEYGRVGTGHWVLKDDNRKKELFLTTDGSQYAVGTESSNGTYDGFGVIPGWLTTISRPSQYHSWDGEQWIIKDENEVQRLADLSATVRQQRDMLIAQSDWTQLDDSPLKGNLEWLNYRRELRDITLQPGFPESVTWPIAP